MDSSLKSYQSEFEKRVNSLNQRLAKRAEKYPERGDVFQKLCEEVREFSDFIAEISLSESVRPDEKTVRDVEHCMENPVFIGGPMKSGTTLISQLLDGHEEALVMPGDSHYLEGRNDLWRRELKAVLCNWTQRLITPLGQEPFWFKLKTLEDWVFFYQGVKYWYRDDVDGFQAGVKALLWLDVRKGEPCPQFWIIKTPGEEMMKDEIFSLFPKAKFIHVMRNPAVIVSSSYRFFQKRGDLDKIGVKSLIKNARLSLIEASRVARDPGQKNCMLLNYEDVVTDSAASVRKMRRFIGLRMTEDAVIPTVGGDPVVANSSVKSRRIKGEVFDRSLPHDFEQVMPLPVVRQVAEELGYYMGREGYPRIKKNTWKGVILWYSGRGVRCFTK